MSGSCALATQSHSIALPVQEATEAGKNRYTMTGVFVWEITENNIRFLVSDVKKEHQKFLPQIVKKLNLVKQPVTKENINKVYNHYFPKPAPIIPENIDLPTEE